MAFKFTDSGSYGFRRGGFYLGLDDHGREVGIQSDRHLITVAGARSGKGAALIVPNLKRWRGSCVVVDPKGENATITARERETMGQLVGVVDPYHVAKDRAVFLRCSINPFALFAPEGRSIRTDLEALGDGLIRRFDPKHEEWAETAARMIAGAADYVMATTPRESWTLPAVRDMFLLAPDDLKAIAGDMLATKTKAALAHEAGQLFLEKLANAEGLPAQAFSKAGKELGWIADPAFEEFFDGSLPEFDMRSLKDGTGSLFLCIPADRLKLRGQFLRLFVSMGLNVMASELADHRRDKGECLFLLDEFHSLGRLEQAATGSGQLPGYGVHMWPFLQDLGQLEGLYGSEEMHTFFANADAHIFFANSDRPTLEYISERLGTIQPDEISSYVPKKRAFWKFRHKRLWHSEQYARDLHDVTYHNKMADFEHKMRRVGAQRLEPQEIAGLVGRPNEAKIARSMIVFARGGDVLNLWLGTYYLEYRKIGVIDDGKKNLDREFWSFFARKLLSTSISGIISGILYVNVIGFTISNLISYMNYGTFDFEIDSAIFYTKLGVIVGIAAFIVNSYNDAKDFMGEYVEDGIKGGWMSPHYAKRYPKQG